MRFFIDDDTSRLFVLASSEPSEIPTLSIKLSPEQHVALLRHSVDSIDSHDLYMVRGEDYPLTANARLLSDEDKRYLRKYMPYVFYSLLRHFAGFFGDGQRLASAMAALREVRVDRRMEYAVPASSRVSYRGRHRMPREYVARTHWLLRDLGQAVRDSIRAVDSEPIDEFISQNVHSNAAFSHIKDDVVAALDRLNEHDIPSAWVLADCGHFELRDDVRDVRVGRRTDEVWCDSCANTRATYPEDDDDTPWDTRVLYNHSDGEWYTYEELEEEEEEDDSDTPIFGYSTNVLQVLSSTDRKSVV